MLASVYKLQHRLGVRRGVIASGGGVGGDYCTYGGPDSGPAFVKGVQKPGPNQTQGARRRAPRPPHDQYTVLRPHSTTTT